MCRKTSLSHLRGKPNDHVYRLQRSKIRGSEWTECAANQMYARSSPPGSLIRAGIDRVERTDRASRNRRDRRPLLGRDLRSPAVLRTWRSIRRFDRPSDGENQGVAPPRETAPANRNHVGCDSCTTKNSSMSHGRSRDPTDLKSWARGNNKRRPFRKTALPRVEMQRPCATPKRNERAFRLIPGGGSTQRRRASQLVSE
jgi:hypothetical protein